MKEVFTIRSLEDLRALCHPTRILLAENLHTPRTIPELAELIDEPPSRLYYHVAELERVGLVRVVKSRKKGNLTERLYQVTAPFTRVDPTIFEQSPEGFEVLAQAVSAILDTTALRFRRALRERRTGGDPARLLYAYQDLHIPSKRADQVRRRLRELLDELKALEEPDAPVTGGLSIVFFPVDEP